MMMHTIIQHLPFIKATLEGLSIRFCYPAKDFCFQSATKVLTVDKLIWGDKV